MTYEQAKTLLKKGRELNWEWYPHVFLALYTGMRSGELYALKWSQISFEARQIKVDCGWNVKDGFKSTKSGDERLVEISLDLLKFLKQLKRKVEGQVEQDFVLPRIWRWKRGDQARELRAFLQAIGLPYEKMRFHDLRATWCTMLLNLGVEPAKVMSQGGWSSLSVLMHYLRQGGISIKGSLDVLKLHDPEESLGRGDVINIAY